MKHSKINFKCLDGKSIFFLIDLDGTLIDSENAHFISYRDALKSIYNIDLTHDEYKFILSNDGIDNYLIKTFGI